MPDPVGARQDHDGGDGQRCRVRRGVRTRRPAAGVWPRAPPTSGPTGSWSASRLAGTGRARPRRAMQRRQDGSCSARAWSRRLSGLTGAVRTARAHRSLAYSRPAVPAPRLVNWSLGLLVPVGVPGVPDVAVPRPPAPTTRWRPDFWIAVVLERGQPARPAGLSPEPMMASRAACPAQPDRRPRLGSPASGWLAGVVFISGVVVLLLTAVSVVEQVPAAGGDERVQPKWSAHAEAASQSPAAVPGVPARPAHAPVRAGSTRLPRGAAADPGGRPSRVSSTVARHSAPCRSRQARGIASLQQPALAAGRPDRLPGGRGSCRPRRPRRPRLVLYPGLAIRRMLGQGRRAKSAEHQRRGAPVLAAAALVIAGQLRSIRPRSSSRAVAPRSAPGPSVRPRATSSSGPPASCVAVLGSRRPAADQDEQRRGRSPGVARSGWHMSAHGIVLLRCTSHAPP